MAQVKNYGLAGVNRKVQLGKQGPHLSSDDAKSKIVVTAEDGTTLAPMSGANAVSSSDFVTKAQLEQAQNAEATFAVTLNSGSGNTVMGTIPAGTKTVITTITVNTLFDGSPSINVGSTTTQNLLLDGNYSDPTVVDTYQSVTIVDLSQDTQISAFPSFANVTQGEATIVVSYY